MDLQVYTEEIRAGPKKQYFLFFFFFFLVVIKNTFMTKFPGHAYKHRYQDGCFDDPPEGAVQIIPAPE